MTPIERQHAAIAKAERDIKTILIALQNDHGVIADSVDVDTRNWTYGTVSINVEGYEGDRDEPA